VKLSLIRLILAALLGALLWCGCATKQDMTLTLTNGTKLVLRGKSLEPLEALCIGIDLEKLSRSQSYSP
jgi:hypothetical protein